MIIALIEHYSNGNKAQFANLLGITPQGLSTWIKRDTFDIELVFSKCEGLSAEWLLSGEGEMFKTKGVSHDAHASAIPDSPPQYIGKGTRKSTHTQEKTDISAVDKQLLDALLEKTEEIGRLKARIAELERRRGDNAPDVRNDLAHAG